MSQLWLLAGPDSKLPEYIQSLGPAPAVEGFPVVALDALPAVVDAVAALVAQYGDLVAGGAFSEDPADRTSYYQNIYAAKVAALEPVVAALVVDPAYADSLLASVMCWDVPPEQALAESRCMMVVIDLTEYPSWVADFAMTHKPQEVQ